MEVMGNLLVEIFKIIGVVIVRLLDQKLKIRTKKKKR